MVDSLCVEGHGQDVFKCESGCRIPVISEVNSKKSKVKHEALSNTKMTEKIPVVPNYPLFRGDLITLKHTDAIYSLYLNFLFSRSVKSLKASIRSLVSSSLT